MDHKYIRNDGQEKYKRKMGQKATRNDRQKDTRERWGIKI